MSDLVPCLGPISMTCSGFGVFFDPKLDPTDSNLYYGQTDSDLPCGGSKEIIKCK